uniref:uncharacterized protein LOC109955244 isoform X2 n=1 Tax=Monopterus albus TaxID=43700 RepID=UPI0009B330AB|nr:uncharacterized protein LOC109955244 isoform X2 [Monopterus albus]
MMGRSQQGPLQMAAMLVLVQLLVMMMMRKSAAAEVVHSLSAQSGETVLLTSDWLKGRMENRGDIRWTHPRLVLSTKNNWTTCDHGRCQLLSNGSLTISQIQSEDSGKYSLEVFDEEGQRLQREHFLLRVKEDSHTDNMLVMTCSFLLLLLLLFFFAVFILRRRRSQRMITAGPVEENVYVMMHGPHGNKRKCDEEQHEREEEPIYIPCNAAVSMEMPNTKQMSMEVEDIYV